MLEVINEKISVISKYDRMKGIVTPLKLHWQGREFFIKKLSYYHRVRLGRNIQHIFHVTDDNLDFRLRLDSETLHWTLEEISDGTAN